MLIQLLRRFLKPYSREVAIVVVLVLIQTIANLYLPNLNADIINNGVVKGDVGYILRTGAWMLGIALVVGVISIFAVYWASQASMGTGRDLRAAVFERVQHFSERDMNHFGTASLITRNTNDIQQIQLVLQIALTILVAAPVMAIGGVIMALREDVRLSSLLIVIVPLMIVIIGVMLTRAVPLFQSMQVKIDRVNQVLREQIMGVRVIRAFIRVDAERARFDVANSDLTSTTLTVNRIFVLAMPTLLGIMNLATLAVLWFGGHLVDTGDMPIGNLTAFLAYILQIMFAVMMAVAMVILVPRAEASAKRVMEVVETEPSIADPLHPVTPANATGLIEYQGLTFGYPGGEKPVLHNLTFSMEPGATTAIIGGTGSGKTTLLNLIPRFFDATSGRLLVDGVDVREQSQDRVWSQIGLVPQQSYLFSGTVADNLRFARPDATDEDLWHALHIAQADDFVSALPEGLLAPIDQGGTNLSGGQRQRLAIARTIVKRPAIYLFDDCFSALDAATDARLRAALAGETKESTVVIVAQRVSTIMNADRIIVLDGGRVVGIGPHQDLMATCPEYREIVESQLGVQAA